MGRSPLESGGLGGEAPGIQGVRGAKPPGMQGGLGAQRPQRLSRRWGQNCFANGFRGDGAMLVLRQRPLGIFLEVTSLRQRPLGFRQRPASLFRRSGLIIDPEMIYVVGTPS